MINDYAKMLSQANTVRADLERQLHNAEESVKRNAIRIVERDEKIATLEAEILAMREAKEEDDDDKRPDLYADNFR
jgi:hypothetical protein